MVRQPTVFSSRKPFYRSRDKVPVDRYARNTIASLIDFYRRRSQSFAFRATFARTVRAVSASVTSRSARPTSIALSSPYLPARLHKARCVVVLGISPTSLYCAPRSAFRNSPLAIPQFSVGIAARLNRT